METVKLARNNSRERSGTPAATVAAAAVAVSTVATPEASAELVNIFMNGTITGSASPNFSASEAVSINFTVETSTPPLVGDPNTYQSHPDSLTAFEFSSTNFTFSTVPETNTIEVYNEMMGSAVTGDFVDLVFHGANVPFQGLMNLGFSSPVPPTGDPTLSSANLHDAIFALSSFNGRGFTLIDNSKSVQGEINSLTVHPVNGLIGDYDRNGVVNGDDLNVWRNEFGKMGIVRADSDLDNDVDGRDFLAWQRNVGNVGNEAALVQASAPELHAGKYSVPEPSTAGLLVSASVLAAGAIRWIKKSFK